MADGNLFNANLSQAGVVPTPLPKAYALKCIPQSTGAKAYMAIRILDETGHAIYETPWSSGGALPGRLLEVTENWQTLSAIVDSNALLTIPEKNAIKEAKAIQIIQIWNSYVSFSTGAEASQPNMVAPGLEGQVPGIFYGGMEFARTYEFLLPGTILGQASWVRQIDAGLGDPGITVRPIEQYGLPSIATGSAPYIIPSPGAQLVVPTQRSSRMRISYRFQTSGLIDDQEVTVTVSYAYRIKRLAQGTMYENSPLPVDGSWEGDIIAGAANLKVSQMSAEGTLPISPPPFGRYDIRVSLRVTGAAGKSIGNMGPAANYVQLYHEVW